MKISIATHVDVSCSPLIFSLYAIEYKKQYGESKEQESKFNAGSLVESCVSVRKDGHMGTNIESSEEPGKSSQAHYLR